MLFNTALFLWFFAAFFVLYSFVLLRHTPRLYLILVASLVFYAGWNYRFIPLLVLSGVVDFAVGDHVIGCLSAFCGNCEFCLSGRPNLCGGEACNRAPDAESRLAKGDERIGQFAHLSSFAEQMLVHENALVKIREDMPLDRAALIGCGVTTGVGAVFRTARIEPGSVVCVLGAGGIGLSAIQAARIAGAGRVFAVDVSEAKLEVARQLGATDTINGAETDAVKIIALAVERAASEFSSERTISLRGW